MYLPEKWLSGIWPIVGAGVRKKCSIYLFFVFAGQLVEIGGVWRSRRDRAETGGNCLA
jgi:hypothetical protein